MKMQLLQDMAAIDSVQASMVVEEWSRLESTMVTQPATESFESLHHYLDYRVQEFGIKYVEQWPVILVRWRSSN
jgi:hypothetical protein